MPSKPFLLIRNKTKGIEQMLWCRIGNDNKQAQTVYQSNAVQRDTIAVPLQSNNPPFAQSVTMHILRASSKVIGHVY